VDDIRKAPDHVLSAKKALSQVLEYLVCENITLTTIQLFQPQFILKSQLKQNNIQIQIIKKRLAKEIPALVADVYEEVVEAFNQYIPVKDGNFS
jgi:hypothetical protein